MNNPLRTILIALLVLVLGAGLFVAGMFAGASFAYSAYGMMGGYGLGSMMRNSAYGPGMMGDMMNGGMMGGMMDGGGMMGGPGYGPLANVPPLSPGEARTAVEAYLAALSNDDLTVKEIMIFDNGAYAIVEEKSTGIGAFELLVDPVGLSVFPEHGPNMMWNLKYGMMSAYAPGMMGGMMMRGWHGGGARIPDVSAEMPVSPEDASAAAQQYLDAHLPGLTVSEEVQPFYGYYTIDLERDGKIVGMLSVNGYTRQVFPHTWHGNFVEESEAAE